MKVTIKNQIINFIPDYNPNKPSENGWKKQNQDAFKICNIGKQRIFVKRFEKNEEQIPGYQFLVKTQKKQLSNLPITHDIITVTEHNKSVTYLFQEVLLGETLEEVIKSKKATLNYDPQKFTKDLYNALSSISQYGYWYTDFVEKNIFVGDSGSYYLIDLDSVAPLSLLPNKDSPELSLVNKNYKIAVSTYWYRDTLNYPFPYIANNLRGDTINFLELFVLIAQISYFIDNEFSCDFLSPSTRKSIPSYLSNINRAETYRIFRSCFSDKTSKQRVLSYDELVSFSAENLISDTSQIYFNSNKTSLNNLSSSKTNDKFEDFKKVYNKSGKDALENYNTSLVDKLVIHLFVSVLLCLLVTSAVFLFRSLDEAKVFFNSTPLISLILTISGLFQFDKTQIPEFKVKIESNLAHIHNNSIRIFSTKHHVDQDYIETGYFFFRKKGYINLRELHKTIVLNSNSAIKKQMLTK